MVKKIEVVAAIIQHEDKTLCVQRGPSKLAYIHQKFEFPGGKVELGEQREEVIKRELKEELHLNIEHVDYFMTVEGIS